MNAIKTVVRDTGKTAGNLANGIGTLSTSISGGAAKGSEGVAQVITATPGVIKALITAPVTASVGFIAEDRGISREDAAAIVAAAMPDSVKEAIEISAEAAGRALATMMAEDDNEDAVAQVKSTKSK